MIDTHSHLYAQEFDADLQDVIERAKAVGLSQILLPNVDLESLDRMDALAELQPDLFHKMYGLHPCSVDNDYKEVLNRIEERLADGDYIAIGEIGIDLYWNKDTRAIQEEAFRMQIDWALKYDKPIVIHSRETIDIITDIIEWSYADTELNGVFHCFTGTHLQAKRLIDLGFMIGIGGVLTFKNSNLREELKGIPLDHIVLETDAPYLAPVPYRGKRNESSYVTEVAKHLSYVYDTSVAEIVEQTTLNAKKLFKI